MIKDLLSVRVSEPGQDPSAKSCWDNSPSSPGMLLTLRTHHSLVVTASLIKMAKQIVCLVCHRRPEVLEQNQLFLDFKQIYKSVTWNLLGGTSSVFSNPAEISWGTAV